MIKLKDIIKEGKTKKITKPNIFVPIDVDKRLDEYIKYFIQNHINNPDATLDLIGSDLTEIPEVIKDLEIKGSFRCSYNELTSLKNSPRIVGGDFLCNHNRLTTLEGATEYIGGTFQCSNNKLDNLDGCPKSVRGDFICINNPTIFSPRMIKKICKVGGRAISDFSK